MRSRCVVAIGAWIVGSSVVAAADSTPPNRTAQISEPPAAVSDVILFVQERGWQVNLGRICAEFDLPVVAGQCIFKQVSVQEIEGRGDPRGFNIPVHQSANAPYVLIFHLGPLTGEFFVVSVNGDLIKAFYRAKGTGYSSLPNDDVREEFKADLGYWFNNLARLKQGVEAQQPQQK